MMAEIFPLTATAVGDLRVPDVPHAVVVVVSLDSDDAVREALHDGRFATLQLRHPGADSTVPPPRAYLRRLTEQLLSASEWLRARNRLTGLPLGIFGTLGGGGAALAAAAARPDLFRALVLRDGGPHIPGVVLHDVSAATLLIVDGHDDERVALNQETMARVTGIAELEILPGMPASDESGGSSHVARMARRWFDRFLS